MDQPTHTWCRGRGDLGWLRAGSYGVVTGEKQKTDGNLRFRMRRMPCFYESCPSWTCTMYSSGTSGSSLSLSAAPRDLKPLMPRFSSSAASSDSPLKRAILSGVHFSTGKSSAPTLAITVRSAPLLSNNSRTCFHAPPSKAASTRQCRQRQHLLAGANRKSSRPPGRVQLGRRSATACVPSRRQVATLGQDGVKVGHADQGRKVYRHPAKVVSHLNRCSLLFANQVDDLIAVERCRVDGISQPTALDCHVYA